MTYYAAHFTQITHKYINHATDKEKNTAFGKMLIFLQKNHVLISPEEHKGHHISENYDINYFCIVNGLANPFLNYIVKNTDIIQSPKHLSICRRSFTIKSGNSVISFSIFMSDNRFITFFLYFITEESFSSLNLLKV